MNAKPLPVLLLLAALFGAAPAGADLPPAAWKIGDDSGDVYPVSKDTGVVVLSNPLNSHMDIVEVQIDSEDEVGFYVTFTLADIHEGTRQIFIDLLATDTLELAFEVAGSPAKYSAMVSVRHFTDPNSPVGFSMADAHAALCLRQNEESPCFYEYLSLVIDDEANTMRLLVTKADLVGKGQPDFKPNCNFFGCDFDNEFRPPPGLPTKISVGDRLTKTRAFFQSDGDPSLSWYDEAPNEGNGPDYVFTQPMANVQIAAYTSLWQPQPVEVGETTSFDVTLENRAATKRIINLTYGLDASSENASKFSVRGPASIAIPHGETRNLTVAVTVAPGTSAAIPIHLVIRGTSFGFPGEILHGRVRLTPIVSLGPNSPNLYFHTGYFTPTGSAVDPALCGVFGCDFTWMNALKDDPADTKVDMTGWIEMRDLGAFAKEFYIRSGGPGFNSAPQLSTRPLAFDSEQPILVKMKFKVDVAVEYQMRADLSSNSGTLLGSANQRVSIPTGGATLTFPLQVAAENLVLNADETGMILDVLLQADATNLVSNVGALNLVKVDPTGSGVTLPLIPPPEDLDQGTPSSPLRLTVQGEKDEYINPGEARLFNVTMLNVGAIADAAHVTGQIAAAGWTLEVLPGADYRLGTGDSVVFGVLAHAPATAKEGETAIVRLNATTDALPNERAFLRLSLIATTGLDVPDDAKAFRVHEDAQEKVLSAPKNKNAPGFGAVGLVAAALLGLAVAARCRKA